MKKTLYILTLEPIEKRYTKQWYRYFKEEFSKYFDVSYINGTIISDEIKTGRFLDINQTNIWKSEQVIKISELFNQNTVRDGDCFFFMDGWHFGLTALKYMSQLNNIKINIYAYWHAGTWDRWDFISQANLVPYVRCTEADWLNICDRNFVATEFHKKLIVNIFGKKLSKKILVVGFPMDWIKEIKLLGIVPKYKEDIVVFPHRLDKEKCPEIFDSLQTYFPKYTFIKTMEVTKDKKEYYEILNKAKVVFSSSKQETFGIGTVEGLMLGCVPLVPRGLSYDELYNPIFQYSNFAAIKQKLKYFIENYDNITIQKHLNRNKKVIINKSNNSIKNMAKVINHGH